MSHRTLIALIVVWSACAAGGLWAMAHYEFTPASTVAANCKWPDTSRLARDAIRPTLVMFVHPRCPCSRASLDELDLLTSQCLGRFALRVVFVRPPETPEGWERTALVSIARQIPGAIVSCDRDGAEACLFGASTSGETFLYAREGELLFQGGLTPSRGHRGVNAGRAAVTALVNEARPGGRQSPVFGCELLNRPSQPEESEVPCHP